MPHGRTRRGPGRPAGGGRSPEEMRDHLIDAAERVLTAGGVDGTTAEAVAEEADVSRSTVYRVFDGRDEILLAVVLRAAEGFVVRLQELIAELHDADVEDLLVQTMAEVVEMGRSPGLGVLFTGRDRDVVADLIDRVGSVHELAHATMVQTLAQLTPRQRDRLRDDLAPDELADFLVHVGLTLVRGADRWSSSPEQTRRYLELFVVPALIPDARRR